MRQQQKIANTPFQIRANSTKKTDMDLRHEKYKFNSLVSFKISRPKGKKTSRRCSGALGLADGGNTCSSLKNEWQLSHLPNPVFIFIFSNGTGLLQLGQLVGCINKNDAFKVIDN
ncbi:MAG: hypothetical protein IPN25_03985 [Sphingobacteriales bacterium]|nr:hypothetical protein [Sphingobacteriales bacterium]